MASAIKVITINNGMESEITEAIQGGHLYRDDARIEESKRFVGQTVDALLRRGWRLIAPPDTSQSRLFTVWWLSKS